MKLPTEFYRLPVHFDVARLRYEALEFSDEEWRAHPQGFDGNSAMVLISAYGGINDEMQGPMRSTAMLERCPYIRQVMASFNTVIGRSRLMRLAPNSEVAQHSDIHYYWHHRVRVHIPIVTEPSVRFWCNGREVHMAEGEAWVFDNWRQHKVVNPAGITRIHLVFDTTGSAAFWDLVHAGETVFDGSAGRPIARFIPYQEGSEADIKTERYNAPAVMDPSEVDLLLTDLAREIALEAGPLPAPNARFIETLDAFRRDWRCLWSVHGAEPAGHTAYQRLIDDTLSVTSALGPSVMVPSSHVTALNVLRSRLQAALGAQRVEADNAAPAARPAPGTTPRVGPRRTRVAARADQGAFDRPTFIIAAPRSGSTLLFETLSVHRRLWTVGGESHEIFESIPGLSPRDNGFESNRLSRLDATPERSDRLRQAFLQELRDAGGARWTDQPAQAIRFLEKTPKNALRIPFLRAVFPEARFIFLHREARANISSIMEAWRSGRFVTYRGLPGWGGLPWSLALIPGWRRLNGKPLEEIAAAQWRMVTQQVLDDLADLPATDWCAVSYEKFVNDPAGVTRRLCTFMEVPFGARMAEITSQPLRNSRYTLTAPDPDKWRANEAELSRVLPGVTALAAELSALD